MSRPTHSRQCYASIFFGSILSQSYCSVWMQWRLPNDWVRNSVMQQAWHMVMDWWACMYRWINLYVCKKNYRIFAKVKEYFISMQRLYVMSQTSLRISMCLIQWTVQLTCPLWTWHVQKVTMQGMEVHSSCVMLRGFGKETCQYAWVHNEKYILNCLNKKLCCSTKCDVSYRAFLWRSTKNSTWHCVPDSHQ